MIDQVADKEVRTELDAIEVLMQDQREVECLFREFEYLHSKSEETNRVVKTACAELKMHHALETEVFFPSILEAAGEPDVANLVTEAKDGQRTIRDLITRVERADADEAQRNADFAVLARRAQRHFDESEAQVFPQAKKLKRLDLLAVASRMKARKSEMLARI